MIQKMGIEDDCSTHLELGLGSQKKKKPCLKVEIISTSCEPSLTLGLPEESRDTHPQGSPHSDLSTFSDTRVKRERNIYVSDNQEITVSRRVTSDEDEDGINARKKLRLTKEQSALLEDSFKHNNTLNQKQKLALAKQLNLRARQVEVWFQNRRARTKLKQTEVDCEHLKKCCEALTHENKRLQKELHELKAMKVAPQFYMHVPAATLTMCPCCEGISGGGALITHHPRFLAKDRSLQST